MQDDLTYELAFELVGRLSATSKTITTAESCTGGMVASAITRISGSSSVFNMGFVTYSNEAKTELIGVSEALLNEKGAVDEDVAKRMALGALTKAKADLALSITGIAGPTGETHGKPIGMVCFAIAFNDIDANVKVIAETKFFGKIGRDEVRIASTIHALNLALQHLTA